METLWLRRGASEVDIAQAQARRYCDKRIINVSVGVAAESISAFMRVSHRTAGERDGSHRLVHVIEDQLQRRVLQRRCK